MRIVKELIEIWPNEACDIPELAFFYSEYSLETHDSVCEYQQYDHCPAAHPFLN